MRYVNKESQNLLNLLKNKGLDYPDNSLYRAFSKKQKEIDLNLLNKDELENIYKEWRELEATNRKKNRTIKRKQKQKQEQNDEEEDLFNYLIDEYEKNHAEKIAAAERKRKQDENNAAMSLLNLNNIGNVSNKNKTGHSTAKHKEIRNRIIRKLPVSERDMINYEKYKQYHRDYARNYNNSRKPKKNFSQKPINRYKSRKNSTKKKEPQINIQQNDIIPEHALIPKNIQQNDIIPDDALIPNNMTENLFNPNEDVNEYEISKDAPINHLNLPSDFQFDEKYDFGYKDSPSVETLIDSDKDSSSVGTLIDSDKDSSSIGTLIDSDKDSSSVGILMDEDKGSNKISNINISSYDPTIQGYLEPLSIDNKPTKFEEHRKEAVDKFRKRKVEEKNNKEKLTKKRKRHAYSIDSLQNLNQKKTRKNKM